MASWSGLAFFYNFGRIVEITASKGSITVVHVCFVSETCLIPW
jgi:hypothetical protein